MKPFHPKSASEQLADYLTSQLESRRWVHTMPGQHQLVAELGVGPETVRQALVLLEQQGLLIPQGPGRRRLIVLPEFQKNHSLRVHLLPYDQENAIAPYVLDFVRQAAMCGHTVDVQGHTLRDLRMNVDKVSNHVRKHPADAWVVVSAIGEVLQWFSAQSVPSFALFGRNDDVQIAGINVRPFRLISRFIHQLIEQGHRRIVWIVREERRTPQPASLERHFLDLLAAHGIETGPYHLPAWEESREGLETCLEQLFKVSPPTAILASEPQLFLGVQNFVTRRGMIPPRDISLVCMDVFESDPSFDWIQPAVSHYRWHWQPVSRRLMRWLENISTGRADLQQTHLEAEYVAGETIGAVPKSARR